MYRHILFPTDGSPASHAALAACLSFARDAGARVTALHVVPEFHVFTYDPNMLEETRSDYLRLSREQGDKLLASVRTEAREKQVDLDVDVRRSDTPDEAIVAAAHEHGCDLIAMATHGRRGLAALALGSVTHQILLRSEIPVLVFRNA
jgi:nucleotide-binding universal stress UspA family protein